MLVLSERNLFIFFIYKACETKLLLGLLASNNLGSSKPGSPSQKTTLLSRISLKFLFEIFPIFGIERVSPSF